MSTPLYNAPTSEILAELARRIPAQPQMGTADPTGNAEAARPSDGAMRVACAIFSEDESATFRNTVQLAEMIDRETRCAEMGRDVARWKENHRIVTASLEGANQRVEELERQLAHVKGMDKETMQACQHWIAEYNRMEARGRDLTDALKACADNAASLGDRRTEFIAKSALAKLGEGSKP